MNEERFNNYTWNQACTAEEEIQTLGFRYINVDVFVFDENSNIYPEHKNWNPDYSARVKYVYFYVSHINSDGEFLCEIPFEVNEEIPFHEYVSLVLPKLKEYEAEYKFMEL